MNSAALPLCLALISVAPAPTAKARAKPPSEPSAGVKVDEPRPVKFGSAPWRTGEQVHSESSFDASVTMHFQVRGEETESYERLTHEKIVKDLEVLAASDQGPSRFSVHYTALDQSSKRAGFEESEEADPNPLNDRSFVLQRKGADTAVVDDQGNPVAVPIAAQVRARELSRDGDFDHGLERLASLLAERPRSIGERITVPSEIALDLFPGDEEIDKARLRLTLRELRTIDGAECAVFKAELHVEGGDSEQGYRLSLDLQGEELFRTRDARFVGAELEGELELSGAVHGEGGAVETTGHGRVALRELRHHSKAE